MIFSWAMGAGTPHTFPKLNSLILLFKFEDGFITLELEFQSFQDPL